MRIDFNRAENFAMAVSHGLVCRGGVDPSMDLCRLLTDRGFGNGPASFWDERGVRCWFVGNIGAVARRYRPTEAVRDRETTVRRAA